MAIRGGNKFTRAVEDIKRRLTDAKTVQVGFFENATYPSGVSVAMVAAIQNYGAPKRGIPPRPFFGDVVYAKSKTWPAAIAKNLRATNYDAYKTLERVGEGVQGQIQQSIRDFSGVPLKPATVRAKGFDKQLIDTGHMLDSVTFHVKF